MTKFIILFMLIPTLCFGAEIVEKIVEIEKPSISTTQILSEIEQVEVKEYLGNKIFKELTPGKNDYVDKEERGTVVFNPKKGINLFGREVFNASNYSFHKIIIPDGTIISGVNFTQKNPHSDAIQGEDLTFIECNLKNVEIHDSWELIDCLQIHTKKIEIIEEDKTFEVYQVEKNGKFEEVSREEIILDVVDTK